MSKKLFSLLIFLTLCGGVLTGCGEKTKNDSKQKIEGFEIDEETDDDSMYDDSSDSFEDVDLNAYPDSDFTGVEEILIGKSSSDVFTIKLGSTKYDEISDKLGYAFEDNKYLNGYSVEGKDSKSASLVKDENSEAMELEFWNLTDEDMDILETVIYGLEYDSYWDQEDGLYMSIAGVETGDSIDDVLKVLGTPDSNFYSIGTEYMSLTYYYNADDCSYELEVLVYKKGGVKGFNFSAHPYIDIY